MNIQELHNKLVKHASMQKVAGLGAKQLRDAIAEFNKIRGDKKYVEHLKDMYLDAHTKTPEPIAWALRPYVSRNRELGVLSDLDTFKTPYRYGDTDLNRLIDRIKKNVLSRMYKIRNLSGREAAEAYEQSLVNKYIKENVHL